MFLVLASGAVGRPLVQQVFLTNPLIEDVGLEDGITFPTVAQWFPELYLNGWFPESYSYHKEVLLNDFQQLDSADDAVRQHPPGAASGSFAAIGFARAGLGRVVRCAQKGVWFKNAPFLVNRPAHLMNLAPRPITRP